MIEPEKQKPSISRQCQLLGLSRSSYYYVPQPVKAEDLDLMRKIDELYLQHPCWGSRSMARQLKRQGIDANRKRIQRLMRLMGIEAVYPRPRTSRPHPQHRVYPYLLRSLSIDRPNQVWASDITYIPMERGFMYLVAAMDWYSRKILSCRISNTLEPDFCVQALRGAMGRYGCPEIFNTDQGSQFTSEAFTKVLKDNHIAISMDGRGRVFDNIFTERLWRTVKYEEVYIKGYQIPADAKTGLGRYFPFYNDRRYHQALAYKTPHEVHYGSYEKN